MQLGTQEWATAQCKVWVWVWVISAVPAQIRLEEGGRDAAGGERACARNIGTIGESSGSGSCEEHDWEQRVDGRTACALTVTRQTRRSVLSLLPPSTS